MKILIAEDDLVSRSFLQNFLEKFGECSVAVNGFEAIDSFFMATKQKEPYDLICLDIIMPKMDGVAALKTIRNLEKQQGVSDENRAKIIMTSCISDARVVQKAFDIGCEAYAAKPIDTEKFTEVIKRLGLIEGIQDGYLNNTCKKNKQFDENCKNTSKQGMKKSEFPSIMENENSMSIDGYFKSVQALPNYRLEVTMRTDSKIYFDFKSRLDTVRFGKLRDEEFFKSVATDGNYLIFGKRGKIPVRITASEFMDLVLVDRRKTT